MKKKVQHGQKLKQQQSNLSAPLSLQVERLGGYDAALDLLQTLLELLRDLLAAHHLAGLGHLAQQLLETPEQAHQRTLVGVGHFAVLLVL